MGKEIRFIAPLHNPHSGYAKAARGILATLALGGWTVQAIESETNLHQTLGYNEQGDLVLEERFVPRVQGELSEREQRLLETALLRNVDPTAPTFVMGNPNALTSHDEFSALERGRLGLTMWETDLLIPQWARAMQNLDALFVPSEWNRQVAGDVHCLSAQVMPLPVDAEVYRPDVSPRVVPHRPKFLFGAVFSTCERKNWRVLMQAFGEEFRGEDVGLLLKPTDVQPVLQLAKWLRSMGVWVEVVEEDLNEAEMASFYTALDAFVLPSTEGFGLPFVEAAMCGVPVAGLRRGGQADILEAFYAMDCPADRTPCVGHLPHVYRRNAGYFTCEVWPLQQMMRTMVDCPQSPEQRTWLAKKAKELYSIEGLAPRINEMLESVAIRRSTYLFEKPESELPSLAVVVTTHNHLERTQACVASLLQMRGVGQIVLADDNSTDGTREWAETVDGLWLVKCETASGNETGNVSANRQMATDVLYRSGHTGYILYVDNDVEVPADLWARIEAVFTGQPSVGVIAPVKVFGDGNVQNIGNRIKLSAGTYPAYFSREKVVVDYVESACMVVHPDVWQEVKWDPQFPIFYEDVDYCFQARELGFEVVATNVVQVTHHAHTSSTARNAESEANRLKFIRKWKERF